MAEPSFNSNVEKGEKEGEATSVHVTGEGTLSRLLGQNDENLRLVEERFPVRILVREGEILISGPDPAVVRMVRNLLSQFVEVTQRGHRLTQVEVRYGLNAFAEGQNPDLVSLYEDVVCISVRGKAIRPITPGQKAYMEAIRKYDVVFAIGPAGTGKTYLAVAQAVAALKASQISRIVLVRPVVEAGERLGYLPGDLREKIEPYLRPLYDAFYDLLSPERFMRYFEKNVIEIAPLAYMRGRTLNDSFIILDEAQNTTAEQMKMFLTRLGFGSKVVVTGDVTQIDLPSGKESGLKAVQTILQGVEGISFVTLDNRDVVRHEIVQRIVRAYEAYEKGKEDSLTA